MILTQYLCLLNELSVVLLKGKERKKERNKRRSATYDVVERSTFCSVLFFFSYNNNNNINTLFLFLFLYNYQKFSFSSKCFSSHILDIFQVTFSPLSNLLLLSMFFQICLQTVRLLFSDKTTQVKLKPITIQICYTISCVCFCIKWMKLEYLHLLIGNWSYCNFIIWHNKALFFYFATAQMWLQFCKLILFKVFSSISSC